MIDAKGGGELEIWGDGKQTRSFLYINECPGGVRKLRRAHFTVPVNLGSEEIVTSNQITELILKGNYYERPKQ